MESLINLIFEHASIAHFITFGALVLAGFNVPISEDLLIIISGIIASTIVPENIYKIFIAIFLGCYLSDNISYWLGRLLGRRLWKIKWLNKAIPKKKLIKAQNYYKKHGVTTLLIGRFIPFGVRNCLFLTAGMSRMKYYKFLLSDGIACLLSNILLFSITYNLGKNYEVIYKSLKTLHILLICLLIPALIVLIFVYRKRKSVKLLQK